MIIINKTAYDLHDNNDSCVNFPIDIYYFNQVYETFRGRNQKFDAIELIATSDLFIQKIFFYKIFIINKIIFNENNTHFALLIK